MSRFKGADVWHSRVIPYDEIVISFRCGRHHSVRIEKTDDHIQVADKLRLLAKDIEHDKLLGDLSNLSSRSSAETLLSEMQNVVGDLRDKEQGIIPNIIPCSKCNSNGSVRASKQGEKGEWVLCPACSGTGVVSNTSKPFIKG